MCSHQQLSAIKEAAEKAAYCLFWHHHLNTTQGYDEWQLVEAAQQYLMRPALESGVLQMPDVSQGLYALVASDCAHHEALGVRLHSVQRGASTLMRQSWRYQDEHDLRLSDDGEWILSHEVYEHEFDAKWVWHIKLDDPHQPPFKLIAWIHLDSEFDPQEIRIRTCCDMEWSGNWQMLDDHLDRILMGIEELVEQCTTRTKRRLEWFV